MNFEQIEAIVTLAIRVLVSLGVIGVWLYMLIAGVPVPPVLDTAAKAVFGAVFGAALSAGLGAVRRSYRR
jgi:hypothetical protein